MATSTVEDYLKCILLEEERRPDALVSTGRRLRRRRLEKDEGGPGLASRPPAQLGVPDLSGRLSKYSSTRRRCWSASRLVPTTREAAARARSAASARAPSG